MDKKAGINVKVQVSWPQEVQERSTNWQWKYIKKALIMVKTQTNNLSNHSNIPYINNIKGICQSGGSISDLRVGWRLGHMLKHLQNCALFQDFIFLLGHKTICSHFSFLLPWHGCYWGRDRSGFNCQCI